MNIAYSFGIVDMLNYGHIRALKAAAAGADLHIFGLVSDSAAIAWMGTLVSNEAERTAVLRGLKYVDEIMPQKTLDPVINLREIHRRYPEAHITLYHGSDWKVMPAEEYLRRIGGSVCTLDYYEKMSPARIRQAMTGEDKNKIFGNLISTKANTLAALRGKIKLSRIEDLQIYTVEQFRADEDQTAREVAEHFGSVKLVVRSSSKNEDSFEASNAGHYESVLGVSADDAAAVKQAFATVIASYEADGTAVAPDEQVLVQTETQDVAYSGVLFTRDIQSNRPYYIINYDDSGSTDSVTSGTGKSRIAYLADDAPLKHIPKRFSKLMQAISELEQLLPGMMLDVEFAIDHQGEVILFQVRPLAASYRFKQSGEQSPLTAEKVKAAKAYAQMKDRGRKRHIFSDMAFWNPSEIIGDDPRPLDYSLYREIVTYRAWTEGLAPMGYRYVDDDLMYRFGNKPYICLEDSFEALIPADLSDALTQKMLGYYCEKLSEDYSAHDKIEFEVVFSCFDFSLDRRLPALLQRGFDEAELKTFRDALFNMTFRVIRNYDRVLREDLESLDRLEEFRKQTEKRLEMDRSIKALSGAVKELLAAVEKHGTPQFARQARCAFIAKSICASLVSEGYIGEDDYHSFMQTVDTVASQFERDYTAYRSGEISRAEFEQKYGHLRAGTYNIRTRRYDQMDLLEGAGEQDRSEKTAEGRPLPKDGVGRALRALGVDDIGVSELEAFLRSAFEQREYVKFIFTRSLSLAVELIREMGEKLGLNVDQMSYLTAQEVMSAALYLDKDSLQEDWSIISEKRRAMHDLRGKLLLPSVITSEADFDYVENVTARPNFITGREIIAQTVCLDEKEDADVSGKIVVIEKADPGYDWIFAKGIAGLITKYGGVASHMSIRCAEFDIPAAIGCGGQIFDYCRRARTLKLDCGHGVIEEYCV